MAKFFKYFSTAASIVLVIFVQLFLSPYRSELEILDVKEKDDNAIVVAIMFLSIAIFLLLLNIFLDRVNKIKLGKLLLVIDLFVVIFCIVRMVYWIKA